MRKNILKCKWYMVCPMKKYYENRKIDEKWIKNYCMGNWPNCIRYQMEEKNEYHPDWMLPDGTINEKLK